MVHYIQLYTAGSVGLLTSGSHFHSTSGGVDTKETSQLILKGQLPTVIVAAARAFQIVTRGRHVSPNTTLANFVVYRIGDCCVELANLPGIGLRAALSGSQSEVDAARNDLAPVFGQTLSALTTMCAATCPDKPRPFI